MIEPAQHTTHEHIISIINTESSRPDAGKRLRILDAGCGDGTLITYLVRNLPELNSSMTWEFYGFDVNDSGIHMAGFTDSTVESLKRDLPEVPWEERIALISAKDPWPYEDCFFDVIISNQVVEHVNNHDSFFSEVSRTLRTGGYSVHLFPLKHSVLESHVSLPFAHRIYNYDLLLAYIKLLSRFGLGIFRNIKKISRISLNEFAEKHADYMVHYTNYLNCREVLCLTKKHHLRASFRYTGAFYTRKARSVLGLPRHYHYSLQRSSLREWLELLFLKYIASVTLLVEKKATYNKDHENPAP